MSITSFFANTACLLCSPAKLTIINISAHEQEQRCQSNKHAFCSIPLSRCEVSVHTFPVAVAIVCQNSIIAVSRKRFGMNKCRFPTMEYTRSSYDRCIQAFSRASGMSHAIHGHGIHARAGLGSTRHGANCSQILTNYYYHPIQIAYICLIFFPKDLQLAYSCRYCCPFSLCWLFLFGSLEYLPLAAMRTTASILQFQNCKD
eukprot:5181150-Amphidinium_carterae.1